MGVCLQSGAQQLTLLHEGLCTVSQLQHKAASDEAEFKVVKYPTAQANHCVNLLFCSVGLWTDLWNKAILRFQLAIASSLEIVS